MQALLQRVSFAKVEVSGTTLGTIGRGLCVFLGIEPEDTPTMAEKLAHKVIAYRIFADEYKAMNRSLLDVQGELLVISQFTLAANTKKGLRPSFSSTCSPAKAEGLYHDFIQAAQNKVSVKTGKFGADMQVTLTNDGPVTFLLNL